MSRNSYAVSWQRKTICCETANRRSREKEGRGVNMNKSEQEREINELFLARAMIRFCFPVAPSQVWSGGCQYELLHRPLSNQRGVYACLCEWQCVCVCVCVRKLVRGPSTYLCVRVHELEWLSVYKLHALLLLSVWSCWFSFVDGIRYSLQCQFGAVPLMSHLVLSPSISQVLGPGPWLEDWGPPEKILMCPPPQHTYHISHIIYCTIYKHETKLHAFLWFS